MTRGHNSTWNSDLGSYFNVDFWPGVSFQRGIMTSGHNSTWNCDPGSKFHVESWPRVTIQRGILTRGHNSTWNYDPGSKFHVESWPRVTIQYWVVIPIPGHNLMLNHDSGSTFNVESRPGVIIQRGIKTWGSQFNGGQNFIRRRGRNTMTPCLGGSQFNMKNPLNPEHSPLNQDPTGLHSMGSKFNPTPVHDSRENKHVSKRSSVHYFK